MVEQRRIESYNCRINSYIDYFEKVLRFLDVPSVQRYLVYVYVNFLTLFYF